MTHRPRQAYVDAIVTNYVRLPGTPLRPSRMDRRFARLLFERRVPLRVVYAAFVLATVRREIRPPNLPRFPDIRTLRYFQGAIHEVIQTQPDPAYIRYIATKLKPLVAEKDAALRSRHDHTSDPRVS